MSGARMVMLAAGRGSRLDALTADRPKPLVEVAGRPLLDWQLQVAVAAGLAPPLLITGYRAEAFAGRALATVPNPDWGRANMVSSLLCVPRGMRAGPVVVSYADILFSARDLRRLAGAGGAITVAYDPNWLALWQGRFDDPLSDAETFRIDDGRIAEIGRTPSHVDEVQGQYMGLLNIGPEGWAAIEEVTGGLDPAARAALDMTGLLGLCIGAGHPVMGMPIADPWFEIDHPSDIAIAAGLIPQIVGPSSI